MSAQEKILNTRIRSKIDTLDNWNKSTLPLLAGEIAIATVPATEENGLTDPVCIIRIGEDGIKPFSQLKDALHAKAIDVLPICKDSDKLKEFILATFDDSELVQNLEALLDDLNNDDKSVTGQYVSAVVQNSGKITVLREDFPDFLQDILIEIGQYEEKECIILKDSKGTILSYADASSFIKDGMLDSAVYDAASNKLTLTWNTDAEKTSTEIDLSDLVKTYTGDNGIEITDEGVIKLNAQTTNLITTSIAEITTETTDENIPSGLIITREEDSRTCNIAIDDSVTFIFNCGNAEVNV